MSARNLQKIIQSLSSNPGVYQMLNADGCVLYVGKARCLKRRVASYFSQAQALDRKNRTMMSQVVDIQTIITADENEALLLEANLIKSLKPRYNVLLCDDKSYPYLYVSSSKKFPRVDFYRGAKRKNGRYFGPYPNARIVRETLVLIQKLFKLRQCSDTYFSNRTRPCLQYQIQRCSAPCVGYVSASDYQQQVNNVLLFLEGKNTRIISNMTKNMEQSAKKLCYERAAYYRNQIITLRKIQKKFMVDNQDNIDIIGVQKIRWEFVVSLLLVRGGRLLGRKNFFFSVPAEITISQALADFIPQYYLNPVRRNDTPERIIVNENIIECEWIQNALQKKLNKKIIITDKKSQKSSHWQKIAKINAVDSLRNHLLQKHNISLQLEALQKVLTLSTPIDRIECFDVSHTYGEATVASCVVFNKSGKAKKSYLRFNITGISPGDDCAAMRQALKRHYTRSLTKGNDLPNLLIIDGGRGQLKQAADILEELQVTGVVMIAIAKGISRKKGEETLFVAGKKNAIKLLPDNPALYLIQRIRDEAHRFAITGHRSQLVKRRLQSTLQNIPSIGQKRRKNLLQHFGGLQALKAATIEEINQVASINKLLAKRIHKFLSRMDG